MKMKMEFIVIHCERHKARMARFDKCVNKCREYDNKNGNSVLPTIKIQPCADAKQWTVDDVCQLEKQNIVPGRQVKISSLFRLMHGCVKTWTSTQTRTINQKNQ